MASYPILFPDLYSQLAAIKEAGGSEPGYFDHPACPYPPAVRPYLKQLFQPAAVDIQGALTRVTIFAEGDGIDVVLREVEDTIEDMKALERVDGLDTTDRIALIRAKTTLLERWSGLKERIFTLKEMSTFQETVIQTMEEVLSVDQRADFVSRLKGLRSVVGAVGAVAHE